MTCPMLDDLFAWAAEQPEYPSIGADFTTYRLGVWISRWHGHGTLQYHPETVIEFPPGRGFPLNFPASFTGPANYGPDPGEAGEVATVQVMAPLLPGGTYLVSFSDPSGDLTGSFVPSCTVPLGTPNEEGGVLSGVIASQWTFVAMQLGSLQVNQAP